MTQAEIEQLQRLSKSQTLVLQTKFRKQLAEKDDIIQTLKARVQFLSDENEMLKSSLITVQHDDQAQLSHMKAEGLVTGSSGCIKATTQGTSTTSSSSRFFNNTACSKKHHRAASA